MDTSRPFTRADAIEAGIEPRLLRGSGFRRLFHGVYVEAARPSTPALRVEAALVLFCHTAFASHVSAARVYGLPVPAIPDEHVSVIRTRDRRRTAGVQPHVHPRPDVRVVGKVRVSAPAQMFVELATLLSLVDLVVVGDSLVRRRLISPETLRSACAASRDAGASPARLAAAYVREDVDSPMETRLRMLLVLAGLPEPEVNRTLRAVDGVPVRRYDLSWRAARAIVEYDGRHHIEREDTWESDLERREAIDDDGWRILVVTGRGIYREPERTVQRVWRLLSARGLPGVPARPDDAWRPHFPS